MELLIAMKQIFNFILHKDLVTKDPIFISISKEKAGYLIHSVFRPLQRSSLWMD